MIQPAAVWNRTAAWLTSLTAIGAVFSYFFIDRFAQQYTAQLGFRGDVREILDFIANLGHGVFCAFVVITVLCLDPANRKSVFLIALAPALAGAVTTLIKWCVFRPRPAIVAGWEARVSDSAFNQESFQSFPSGHTATAFALATALAMMYPHGRVYFYGLAVLVGVQRVLVQTHYPSDVLVGSLIGFVIAAATGIAMRKREARDERAHRGQQ